MLMSVLVFVGCIFHSSVSVALSGSLESVVAVGSLVERASKSLPGVEPGCPR